MNKYIISENVQRTYEVDAETREEALAKAEDAEPVKENVLRRDARVKQSNDALATQVYPDPVKQSVDQEGPEPDVVVDKSPAKTEAKKSTKKTAKKKTTK